MTNAFDVLAQDHAEVAQMLTQLELDDAKQATVTDEQRAQRKQLAEQAIIEQTRHEAFEETYFWPAVREHMPDGEDMADTAISQKQDGGEVLDELGKLDAGTPEFEALLAEFIRVGRIHIAYEENHVWPGLRGALTEEQLNDLGSRLQAGKNKEKHA